MGQQNNPVAVLQPPLICAFYQEMTIQMADKFTEKQGQYLAFIYNYTIMNGRPPAEADLVRFFQTSPPTIHQMILKLEEKGLISRVQGRARSIRLLMDPEEVPRLRKPSDPEDRTAKA